MSDVPARVSPAAPVWVWGLAIVVAVAAAYANTWSAPFVFDDQPDIVGNLALRRLWPLQRVILCHADGQTCVHNRPVVALTFALNFACSGVDPTSYHAVNLAIHAFAALTLFGIVRRTVRLPRLERLGTAADPLAFCVALPWALHPLQTQAVTYTVQRYESLMAAFYLLSLYAAIRAATTTRRRRWTWACGACCLLALGSKEVAISVPLAVLLYDRAFLAGSFREAWRARRGLYMVLAASVGLFLLWYAFTPRKTWAGSQLPISRLEYALSQPGVILHYLRLTACPSGQCLDYAWQPARSFDAILWPGLALLGLVAACGWSLYRNRAWGFLGACFFLILAPTSSIVPIADLAFEHRMYLPLAALLAGVVLTSAWLASSPSLKPAAQARVPGSRVVLQVNHVVAGTMVVAVLLGIATFRRNAVYASDVSLWRDTVEKSPRNHRAWNNLATVYLDAGDYVQARQCLERCHDLDPDYADAWANLGVLEGKLHNHAAARSCFERALALKPDHVGALAGLGPVLLALGDVQQAHQRLGHALRIDPHHAAALTNLGHLLLDSGDYQGAAEHYRRALQVAPHDRELRVSLAGALLGAGRAAEAADLCREVLTQHPDCAAGHLNLASALGALGRPHEAAGHFREALRWDPHCAEVHAGMAQVMAATDPNAALGHMTEALRLKPGSPALNLGMGNLLAGQHPERAIAYFEAALKSQPDYPQALFNLANAWVACGHPEKALPFLEQAVKLAPQWQEAQNNLRILRQGTAAGAARRH